MGTRVKENDIKVENYHQYKNKKVTNREKERENKTLKKK